MHHERWSAEVPAGPAFPLRGSHALARGGGGSEICCHEDLKQCKHVISFESGLGLHRVRRGAGVHELIGVSRVLTKPYPKGPKRVRPNVQ
jgi:hypothetical protein